MKCRGRALAVVTSGLLLGTFGAEAQTGDAPALSWAAPERYQLANGLEVILQSDTRTSEIAVLVSYGVGKLDDPRGKEQLSHLVEHMTYRGSRHVPSLQSFSLLERWGARETQGYVNEEYTAFETVVPAEYLERAACRSSPYDT